MSTETKDVGETHSFQAEVTQLLHLMVHSVYSESDIFLRELISNASDACDKLRYETIAKPELLGEGGALTIRITPDDKAGTLTISDTGIGMDRQELIDNLGTIARSGTRAFLDKLPENGEGSGLIGQFGVGFYSAFMVSGEVEVWTAGSGQRRLAQLPAGKVVQVDHRSHAVQPLEIPVSMLLDWQQRRVSFRDERLDEVAAAFNRHNQVQVRLTDDAARAARLSGSLEAHRVAALQAFLQRDARFVIRREADTVWVSSR